MKSLYIGRETSFFAPASLNSDKGDQFGKCVRIAAKAPYKGGGEGLKRGPDADIQVLLYILILNGPPDSL